MTNIPLVDLTAQYHSIKQEINETIQGVINRGNFILGAEVKALETEIAAYCGTNYAIGVASGTDALHLALLACGIGPGDEVITTPFTFIATAEAIARCGAVPVFTDIEPQTYNIDTRNIEAKITDRTRAILPVHYAGRACDMDAIMDIANRHGLKVVEDAAHAVEATWKGRKVGGLGHCASFSFYANKNITTAEGGMAVTNDAALAERMRMLSLHGVSADAWRRFHADGPAHVQVMEAGYKYNMTDIQAALGLGQLAKIDAYHRRREELWRTYDEALADLPLILPAAVEPECRHARHLYTVLVDNENASVDRDELRAALKARNIGTGLHYIALHLHPFYQERFGLERGKFPNAEFISDRTLSLPLSPRVTDEDAQDVVEALGAILT